MDLLSSINIVSLGAQFDLWSSIDIFFVGFSLTLVLLFLSLTHDQESKRKQENLFFRQESVAALGLAIFVLIVALALQLNQLWVGDSTTLPLWGIMKGTTSWSCLFKSIVVTASILCCVVAWSAFQSARSQEVPQGYEYSIVILLNVLGLILVVGSNDFLLFYLALELHSIASYVLAGFHSRSAYSTEAGTKYFLIGAIASGFLLFGMSLVYVTLGTTNFDGLQTFFELNSSGYTYSGSGVVSVLAPLGLCFILLALTFKLGVFPFHLWVADVYEGSPTPVGTFFAVVPKIVLACLYMRFFILLGSSLQDMHTKLFSHGILTGIILLGLFSIWAGAYHALVQQNIKRFLAYSSVGHIGFFFLGISSFSLEGFLLGLLYLILYIPIALGTWTVVNSYFSIVNHPATRESSRTGETKPVLAHARFFYLADLKMLSRKAPVLAVTVSILILSLAGVPPFAGFTAKASVLYAALCQNMFFPALIGVLGSLLGGFYYVRFIKIMYTERNLAADGSTENEENFGDALDFFVVDRKGSIVLAVSVFIIVFYVAFMGVVWNSLYWATPLLVS
jgi:NADH-quinone oxidoreductase subunit N